MQCLELEASMQYMENEVAKMDRKIVGGGFKLSSPKKIAINEKEKR